MTSKETVIHVRTPPTGPGGDVLGETYRTFFDLSFFPEVTGETLNPDK